MPPVSDWWFLTKNKLPLPKMKITIDTKEDSHEDIKKIVTLLSDMLGNRSPVPNNMFDSPGPEVPNVMNMFDQPASPVPSTLPFSPEPLKKQDPQIEFY